MAKRFTDTKIWDEDWYIDLPNKYKLTWNFIKDKCDISGVWKPNKSILQKIVGEPINLNDFLLFINNDEKVRIIVLPNGRWWIRDFFIFQYGDKFSPTSLVHKGVLKVLVGNGVHIRDISINDIGNLEYIDFQELREIAYHKGTDRLLIAYENPTDRVKEKVKEKDIYIQSNLIDTLRIEQYILNKENVKTFEMIVLNMMAVWQRYKPDYIVLIEEDYHSLLEIAYYIAEQKGWRRQDVLDIKEADCISSFEKIVAWMMDMTNAQFYKTMPLDKLSKKTALRDIQERMKTPQSVQEIQRLEAEKKRIDVNDYMSN